MLSEYTAFCIQFQPGDERTRKQSEFAQTRVSKALEPQVEDDREKDADDPTQTNNVEPAIPDRTQKVKTLETPLRTGFAERGDPVFGLSRASAFIKFLPSKEVVNTLISALFEHVHTDCMIFHRGSF